MGKKRVFLLTIDPKLSQGRSPGLLGVRLEVLRCLSRSRSRDDTVGLHKHAWTMYDGVSAHLEILRHSCRQCSQTTVDLEGVSRVAGERTRSQYPSPKMIFFLSGNYSVYFRFVRKVPNSNVSG